MSIIELGLEMALEEQGWGKQARLYTIVGTSEEPQFKAFADIDGHPCDVLKEMYDAGIKLDDGTIGLVLVVEGVRHLRLDEIEGAAPDVWRRMVQLAAEEREPDEIQTAVETAWAGTVSSIPADQMPDNLKISVRNSVAVMHTGHIHMVVRDRGSNPEVLDVVPPERLALSRVPHFMWLYLTGAEPTD